MKPRFFPSLLLAGLIGCGGAQAVPVPAPIPQAASPDSAPAQSSEESAIEVSISAPQDGELMLMHRLHIAAPKDKVWAGFATEAGWRGWVSPIAEMDFRAGGTIRSHYDTSATIGDPGTIVLHIRNYVLGELITLQAELSENFPEILKADADRMYNVIVLSENERGTTLTSYGVGYSDSKESRAMLDKFATWNSQSYQKLRDWAEAK